MGRVGPGAAVCDCGDRRRWRRAGGTTRRRRRASRRPPEGHSSAPPAGMIVAMMVSVSVVVVGGAGFIGSHLVDRLLADGQAVDVVDDLSTGSLANLAGGAVGRRRAQDPPSRRGRERDGQLVGDAPARGAVPPRDRDVGLGVGRLPRGRVRPDARAARGRPPARHPEGRRRRSGDRDLRPAGRARPADQGARARTARRAGRRRASDRRPAGHVPRAARRRVHGAWPSSSVYGPRQRPDGGVVAALRRRGGERRGRRTIAGDGRQTRDFVFVDDVVDALVRAGSRGSGLVVNIGTGAQTSVRDLWALIAGATAPEPIYGPPAVRRAAALRGVAGPGPDPPRVVAVDRAEVRTALSSAEPGVAERPGGEGRRGEVGGDSERRHHPRCHDAAHARRLDRRRRGLRRRDR